MSELLDWVERAAIENFKMHHASADILAKESATTLAVLLAGLGGGTAYAVRAVTGDAPSAVEIGAVVFTAHLLFLCAMLVWKCLMIRPIPSVFNEPANLLNDTLTLDQIRKYELQNMQDGIKETKARNRKVATSLNRIRLATVFSPIWFLVAFGCHWMASAPSVPAAG